MLLARAALRGPAREWTEKTTSFLDDVEGDAIARSPWRAGRSPSQASTRPRPPRRSLRPFRAPTCGRGGGRGGRLSQSWQDARMRLVYSAYRESEELPAGNAPKMTLPPAPPPSSPRPWGTTCGRQTRKTSRWWPPGEVVQLCQDRLSPDPLGDVVLPLSGERTSRRSVALPSSSSSSPFSTSSGEVFGHAEDVVVVAAVVDDVSDSSCAR